MFCSSRDDQGSYLNLVFLSSIDFISHCWKWWKPDHFNLIVILSLWHIWGGRPEYFHFRISKQLLSFWLSNFSTWFGRILQKILLLSRSSGSFCLSMFSSWLGRADKMVGRQSPAVKRHTLLQNNNNGVSSRRKQFDTVAIIRTIWIYMCVFFKS